MTRRQGYGIGGAIAILGAVLVIWDLAEWVFGEGRPELSYAWIAGSSLILAGVLFAAWSRSRAAETVMPGPAREDEEELGP